MYLDNVSPPIGGLSLFNSFVLREALNDTLGLQLRLGLWQSFTPSFSVGAGRTQRCIIALRGLIGLKQIDRPGRQAAAHERAA